MERWMSNPYELNTKYQASNQRAVDALQKYGSSKVEMRNDGSLKYPSDILLANRKEGPLPKHLSIEEELLLRRFFEGKIQQVCASFQLPNKIQATTIMYFKKFYQKWSVMEHDPKKIMLTCIYVACQVEDHFVSVEEFGRGRGEDLEFIYKYEMLVVESVEFDLMVHTPYHALQGFIYFLKPFVQRMGSIDLQALEELQRATTIRVDKMMLTNAPLYYPPGQLALAALRIANRNEPKINFEGYLQTLPNSKPLEQLNVNLDAIEELVKVESREPLQIELSHIDCKRKCCRNSGLLQRR